MKVFGLILGGITLLAVTCVIVLNPFIFSFLIPLGPSDAETHFSLESVKTTPTASSDQLPITPGEMRAFMMGGTAPASKESRRPSNFSEMGIFNIGDLKNLDEPPFVPGEDLKLLPQDSHAIVSLPGLIQFMAELSNPYPDQLWQVKVEAIVINADGSTRVSISPRAIWLLPGQTIKLPIKFKAKEPRYHVGFTLFKAFIKDMNGKILDQASIAFMLQKEAVP